jgi:profilin
MQPSAQEISSLVKGFDDPSALQAGGIHVSGKKYFALQANPRSIYGKQSVSRIEV